MDSLLNVLGEHLPTVVFGVISALAMWGISKLNLEKQAKEVIEALVQRTLDKSQEWVKAAMTADSDGGVKITAKELSDIRQKAWELIKDEAKGPVGKLILGWGEQRVKGMIGLILDKAGVKVTI